jgi:microcystin-dependent protein
MNNLPFSFFPSDLPIGTVVNFAGNALTNTSPPIENTTEIAALGWMICDGRKLKREEYPALFSVIGDLYGSPDKDSFNIPDYRGLFFRGNWTGDDTGKIDGLKKSALENRVKNQNSSQSGLASLQTDAIQTHEHIYDIVPAAATSTEPGTEGAGPTPPKDNTALTENGPTSDLNSPPGNVKVSQTETRPYNIFINYIIKVNYLSFTQAITTL